MAATMKSHWFAKPNSRFMGFLIKHYAGNFPFWLAPDQVRRGLGFLRDTVLRIECERARRIGETLTLRGCVSGVTFAGTHRKFTPGQTHEEILSSLQKRALYQRPGRGRRAVH